MSKYSPYILYLLISLLVVILAINDFGPLNSLQTMLNDTLGSVTAKDGPRPNVAIVRIDGRAQETFGPWPWNHDLVADLAAAVASAEPKAIVLDLDLAEDAAQDSAGYTGILAEQLRWMDRAVLQYDIALANFRSDKTSNPPELFRNSVIVDNPVGLMEEESSLLARKTFMPAGRLIEHKPYLGFQYYRPDDDRVLRYQPLLANFEGYYYPSIDLLAAAVFLNVPPGQIVVKENECIQLGSERVLPINEHSEFFVSFLGETPFLEFSASEVLGEGFDFNRLKDRAVIIGLEDDLTEASFDTPVGSHLSTVLTKATVIENIINNNIVTIRRDLAGMNLILLLVLGGFFAFVLPRVSMMYRTVILGGGLIVLANLSYMMFSAYQMVLPTVYLALEFVLFMLASPLLDSELLTGIKASPAHAKTKVPAPPKRHAGESSEVPVREIKAKSTDPDSVATTAMDSDSGRMQDSSAIDHRTITLDEDAPKADSGARPPTIDSEPVEQAEYISGNDQFSEPAQHSQTPHEMFDSQGMPAPGAAPEIQNLGRYQVSGILGKGAMGTVYKGVDPAINRPVALKTIRLDFVTDPDELAELKERLHREAQAAGKLSHPNIVTIYDVGSEGSLQYIAMEYLEGQTLESLIKKKVRFNYRIIAQIISQICLALEYAHDRGIVHRDIKPANIMVMSDYRVKVMDYGIARVDSNSMTKTGIAMGTPNYISPEQLKGLATDRRADLFSMGVVMYEMLLGRRPFKGENITSLMYAIMHKDPEKPSSVNPQIPLLFDHIIGRALKKDPAERYQKASEIQADLRDFVESFAR